MPQLGCSAEADAVLASQSQAKIHIFAGCMWKSLVERKLLSGISLHAKVQGRHVPEFLPVREQPLPRQGSIDLVIPVQKRGPPRMRHAAHCGKFGFREEVGHVTMPVSVEYAIMVREEDELMTCGERLGYGDIPSPSRPAVRLQHYVFDIVVCQGVL